jgi:hypothetical protein
MLDSTNLNGGTGMKQPRRKRSSKFLPYIRAGGVVAAVMIVVSGVTFAALQSQQVKLTGNSIQTATANLQLSPDAVNYSLSQIGFAFGAIVPGGQASPTNGYTVFLKNAGGTPLALKLAVSSTPTNLDNVDLTKVHIVLTPTSGGSVENFTLQSLIASYGTGGQTILAPAELMPGLTAEYKLQVSMDTDAINGSSATINNVDFSFSGTALSQ